jgi:cellulose biosynthesis protein BcsQ
MSISTTQLYSVANLRGGVGKTKLLYKIYEQISNALFIDTSPQADLTDLLYKNRVYKHIDSPYDIDTNELITNRLVASLATSGKAKFAPIKLKNNNYLLPSSPTIMNLPYILEAALRQIDSVNNDFVREAALNAVQCILSDISIDCVYVLRERGEKEIPRTIFFDTSPFLAGGTIMSLWSSYSVIVPMICDMQSLKSLELFIKVLKGENVSYSRFWHNTREKMTMPKIKTLVFFITESDEENKATIIDEAKKLLLANTDVLDTDVLYGNSVDLTDYFSIIDETDTELNQHKDLMNLVNKLVIL